MEITEEDKKLLRSRLRRLTGQAESLERLLERGDTILFVTQLEAVIAAAKASLSLYAEKALSGSDNLEDQKLLIRLIKDF